jgi:diguanylate cyclase (GGDEF)-like protein
LSRDDPSRPPAYEALDYLPLGLIVADADLRVVFWNACLEDWTGIERAAMLGSLLSQRFPHFAEPRYLTRLATVLATGAPTVLSAQLHPHLIPCPLRGGRRRVLHTVAAAVPAVDRSGSHLLLALQDVTSLSDTLGALAAARDDLARQAATDPLTGIANRRHFAEEAGRIIATAHRHGRPCALLEMDLDGLKAVNDTHGHAVGDELLLAFVRTCRARLREGDVLGRLGGDEFAALLPETTPDQAESIAQRAGRVRAGEPARRQRPVEARSASASLLGRRRRVFRRPAARSGQGALRGARRAQPGGVGRSQAVRARPSACVRRAGEGAGFRPEDEEADEVQHARADHA